MFRVIKERGRISGRTITLNNIPKLRDNEQVEVLICFPDGLDRDDENCIEAVFSPKSEDASHATIVRTIFGDFDDSLPYPQKPSRWIPTIQEVEA
jgi:hypothetical protein